MPPQRSLLCSRSCSRSDRGTPHAFVQRSLPPLSFLLRSARTFAAADDAQSALVSVGGRARGTGRGESRAKSHTRRRGSATRRLSRLLSPRYGRAALRDSSVHCDGSVRAERGPAARSGRDRPVPSAGPRFRGDQVTAAAGRERLRGSPGAPDSNRKIFLLLCLGSSPGWQVKDLQLLHQQRTPVLEGPVAAAAVTVLATTLTRTTLLNVTSV